MSIIYRPIGIIHSPFTKPEGMPILPAGAVGVEGSVEIYEDYKAGLKRPGWFFSPDLIVPFPPEQRF